MIFTKRELGEKLNEQISLGRNSYQIGEWAHTIFFENCRELNSEIREIIEILLIMEEGPEFQYTQNELKLLARKLIDNEKDPIKQITI